MGNRAIVVFKDSAELSPQIYLHWAASDVPLYLYELNQLMVDQVGDASYTAARFVGIAHMHDKDSSTSIGIMSTPSQKLTDEQIAEFSHGDAGVFLVDVSKHPFTVRRLGDGADNYGECCAPQTWKCNVKEFPKEKFPELYRDEE